MSTKTLLKLALVSMLSLSGCIGTESGNPPPASPVIGVRFDDMQGQAVVVGMPGAASPPGATLQLTNLTSGIDPVAVVVADDGSFEVTIEAVPGDAIRLVVLTDDTHSRVFLVSGASDDPAPTDCIRAGGDAVDVPAGGATTFPFTNTCEQAAVVEVLEVRNGADLAVAPRQATPLAIGETTELQLTNPEGTFVHAIVVIEVRLGADRAVHYLSVFSE